MFRMQIVLIKVTEVKLKGFFLLNKTSKVANIDHPRCNLFFSGFWFSHQKNNNFQWFQIQVVVLNWRRNSQKLFILMKNSKKFVLVLADAWRSRSPGNFFNFRCSVRCATIFQKFVQNLWYAHRVLRSSAEALILFLSFANTPYRWYWNIIFCDGVCCLLSARENNKNSSTCLQICRKTEKGTFTNGAIQNRPFSKVPPPPSPSDLQKHLPQNGAFRHPKLIISW